MLVSLQRTARKQGHSEQPEGLAGLPVGAATKRFLQGRADNNGDTVVMATIMRNKGNEASLTVDGERLQFSI